MAEKSEWIRGLAAAEGRILRFGIRLHGGSRDGLEVAPNLWAGVGLVRGGAGTALVPFAAS
ncbi:hypothetical protein [Planomonospora corallina]